MSYAENSQETMLHDNIQAQQKENIKVLRIIKIH